MAARAGTDGLAVLTYHSISDAGGPTSIPPATFRMQLDALAARGVQSLTCAEFIAWHQGRDLAGPHVLITFDDAYADFATAAQPALATHGYTAVVFVPTGRVGGPEAWVGAHPAARPLLDWETIRSLHAAGTEFGGHGVTHADLTRLPPWARRAEIEGAADALAQHLGVRPAAFAAPYGSADPAVRDDIARRYAVAFGTRFDRATRASDRYDVPRIEMHYFRDRSHWEGWLAGREGYFLARKLLRAVRGMGARLLAREPA